MSELLWSFILVTAPCLLVNYHEIRLLQKLQSISCPGLYFHLFLSICWLVCRQDYTKNYLTDFHQTGIKMLSHLSAILVFVWYLEFILNHVNSSWQNKLTSWSCSLRSCHGDFYNITWSSWSDGVCLLWQCRCLYFHFSDLRIIQHYRILKLKQHYVTFNPKITASK